MKNLLKIVILGLVIIFTSCTKSPSASLENVKNSFPNSIIYMKMGTTDNFIVFDTVRRSAYIVKTNYVTTSEISSVDILLRYDAENDKFVSDKFYKIN